MSPTSCQIPAIGFAAPAASRSKRAFRSARSAPPPDPGNRDILPRLASSIVVRTAAPREHHLGLGPELASAMTEAACLNNARPPGSGTRSSIRNPRYVAPGEKKVGTPFVGSNPRPETAARVRQVMCDEGLIRQGYRPEAEVKSTAMMRSAWTRGVSRRLNRHWTGNGKGTSRRLQRRKRVR